MRKHIFASFSFFLKNIANLFIVKAFHGPHEASHQFAEFAKEKGRAKSENQLSLGINGHKCNNFI